MKIKWMLGGAMGLAVFGMLLFFASPVRAAATCTSQKNGTWDDSTVWSGCTGGGAPQSGDDVVIQSGHAVTVTQPVTFDASNTLTISGTLAIEQSGVFISTASKVTVKLTGKSATLKVALGGGLTAAFQTQGGGDLDLSSLSTSGAVEYYGGITQTVTDRNYGGLVFSGTGTKSWTLATDRTVRYAGVTIKSADLTLIGSATLFDIGDWRNDSTGTFSAGGITVNFNSNVQQSIWGASPTIFNNVTISSTNIVTQSTPITITGSLNVTSGEFRQRNDLTVQGGVQNNATLSASNKGFWLRGNFTNNGTFNHGNGTVNFDGVSAQIINGSSATTFYNLSTSNTAGVSLNRDISVANNLFNNGGLNVGTSTVTAFNLSNMTGTFDAGSGLNPLTITGNFWNMAAGTFNANNRTLQFGGNWQNDGAFNAGTSTVTFNGTTGQQFISGASATTFNNVTVTNVNGVRFDRDTTINQNFVNNANSIQMGPGVTLTCKGDFQNDGAFNVSNNDTTVAFGGTAAQSLGGTNAPIFKHLIINNLVGVTLNQDIEVRGNLMNNGVFNTGSRTVHFGGFSPQTIGGTNPITFENLDAGNPTGLTFAQSATVNGTLTLNGDLFTGSNTLTLGSGASVGGNGDVFGRVRRAHTFVADVFYSFTSGGMQIRFNPGGTQPNDITVTLTNTKPTGLTNAVERTYNVTQNGGSGFSALLKLHYRDTELNGIPEDQLELWRYDGARWVLMPKTAPVETNGNTIERNNVTDFSDWAMTNNGAPTSVTLSSFTARANEQQRFIILATLIGLSVALIGATGLIRRRRAS